jgi:autotransporter-associated beta strand protein
MKKLIQLLVARLSKGNVIGALALMVAAFVGAPDAKAISDIYWDGGTADFNIGTNWVGGVVPTGNNAENDNGSNNVVLINIGDPAWNPWDVRAGNENNDSGAFAMYGGTINLGGWFRMGVANGSFGEFTLYGGTINENNDHINIGENGAGLLNIYGGSIVMNAGSGDFAIGDTTIGGGASDSGVVNQTNGTVTINGQFFVGNANGSGVFNLSGGSFSVNNWVAIGRQQNSGSAVGVVNQTGGTFNQTGGNRFLVGTSGNSSASSGTWNMGGGALNVQNQFLVPEQGPAAVGTFNLTNGVITTHDWFVIGRFSGTGYLNIYGGSITRDNANDGGAYFDIGAGGPGTVNQNGGAVTNLAGQTWIGDTSTATWNLNSGIASLGSVLICVNGTATGTLNVNGGLCQVNGINSSSIGFSTLSLNGGTVQALGNNQTFISGISLATVGPNPVTIDSQSYTIKVPEALQDNGGGLVKNGSGTLYLSGANSYSGTTTVNAGTLETTTATGGGADYTVAAGAALDVQVASSGTQLSVPDVTFSGAGTLDIDLNTFGVPSSAPLKVSGVLTAGGTVTLNVLSSAPIAVGTVPLVQYGTPAGAGSFVLGSIPAGETGHLVNSGGVISLVITSAGAPRWNGNVSGVWDINATTNWVDLITSSPTTYHDGEPILFDDNATGTTSITLGVTVAPGEMTVNNSSKPYTISGSGNISGSVSLVKEGTSSLTIGMSGNTFTGPVVLDGGSLSVASLANGGSASAIGASSASPTNLLFMGGTLSYTGAATAINRGYSDNDTNSAVDIDAEGNLTLTGSVIAAPGAGFTKTGPATLAYAGSGTNILSDALGYTVLQGTVLMGGASNGLTNEIAGNLWIGTNGSTNAILAITNNSTVNVFSSGNVHIGDGNNASAAGSVTQTGGTLNIAGAYQTFVGNNSNGVGNYTLSGGSLILDNWLAVGRLNGVGTLTMSGGLLDIIGGGGAFDIGTSAGVGGAVGTGTFTQTGGVVSNNCPTWLGEGTANEPAQGTWNMTGGTDYLIGNVGPGSPNSLLVGVGGIGTNVMNISGTAAVVCANYVSVGQNAGVWGILNIGSTNTPGGSLTVPNGQDFDIGDSGNGILNMVANGGGSLYTAGTMYMTRGSAASGLINLNGGTLTVGYLNNGWGFGNNLTNNSQGINFNGGILKAATGSPYFIQPYVSAVVRSGGAIIDDGGYTITVLCSLVDGGGGGGFTKQGSGTLYLNNANTYTGATLVTAGALGLTSTGSIAAPVTVESGAALLADGGTIATVYINNTLTLQPGSAVVMKLTPASNDEIAGLTGVNYGGTLVVTNTSGSPLTSGAVYKLFNSASPGSGNFSSVTILPSGSGTFNPATGELTITSTGALLYNAPYISGGNLILTGAGGTAGDGYSLLSSTNLNIPVANWLTNATGTFSGTGTFSNAIPATNTPALFFVVKPD